MKQNELILEYLDGTLDPAAEQELFETLAGQPELRTTLRGFVQIGDAVRGDREAFTPPAAVEASLMRRLGLAAVPGNSTRGAGLLAFFRTRAFGLAAAFLLGALLTAGIYRVAVRSDIAQTGPVVKTTGSDTPRRAIESALKSPSTVPASGASTISSEQQVPKSSANSSEVPPLSAPQSASISGENRSTAATTVVNRVPRVRTTPSLPVVALQNDVDQNGPPPRRASRDILRSAYGDNSEHLLTTRNGRPPDIVDRSTTYPRLNSAATLGIDLSVPDETTRGDWIVELRHGFASTDLETVEALNPSTSWVEDGALGVYRHVGSNVALGVELGAERYSQRIPHVAADTVAIDQRPLYTWGGAAVRYFPGRVIGLDPMFQGGFGIASAGPVVRGRFGLSRDILSGFKVALGVESSALMYKAGDVRQISGRWGGFAGLEVMVP